MVISATEELIMTDISLAESSRFMDGLQVIAKQVWSYHDQRLYFSFIGVLNLDAEDCEWDNSESH
jgi:hypothetical protein